MPLLLVLMITFQAAGEGPKTIAMDGMSGVERPRQAVARTDAEWETLWRDHAGDTPRPKVDFGSSMVAAVFLGSRMSAGYEVQITGTRRDGDVLVVEWAEKVPARGTVAAQVITSPGHIVALPKFDGEVRFEKVTR